MNTSNPRAAHIALAVALAALLVLPFFETMRGLDTTTSVQEKRRLTPFPAPPATLQALTGWPRQFDAWFGDHVGFRSTLIAANLALKVRLLGIVSSDTVSVLLGRDGWLYYTGQGEGEDMRRSNPLSAEQLDRWCRVSQDRQRWLTDRGIHFMIVLAPNKESVYPEHLPASMVIPNRPSRADQLVAAMQSRTTVDLLDLRTPLQAAKGPLPLYLRTDSHWTQYGAYQAYLSIIGRLSSRFPALRPRPPEYFVFNTAPSPGGDLATMLGVPDLGDEGVVLTTTVPRHAREVASDDYATLYHWMPLTFPVITGCPDAEVARALVLRDSFGGALWPFLAEHFRRAVFLWWDVGFPTAVIEKEHPDLVVLEIVERMLNFDPPGGSPAANSSPHP